MADSGDKGAFVLIDCSIEQFLLRMLYLFLSFPLGIFYFVFLITGVSLGIGLSIIWIGIPLLFLVITGWWGMARLERTIAAGLLQADLAPAAPRPAGSGLIDRLKRLLTDPFTWKGLLFLFLKFPLGILSFVLSVSLVSVSLSLILAPFYYWIPEVDLNFVFARVVTMEGALFVSLVGVAIGFVTVIVLNGLALMWRSLAQVLLDIETVEYSAPVQAAPVTIP